MLPALLAALLLLAFLLILLLLIPLLILLLIALLVLLLLIALLALLALLTLLALIFLLIHSNLRKLTDTAGRPLLQSGKKHAVNRGFLASSLAPITMQPTLDARPPQPTRCGLAEQRAQ